MGCFSRVADETEELRPEVCMAKIPVSEKDEYSRFDENK